MSGIFKATCPACSGVFDCDLSLLSPDVEELRCPYCWTYFVLGDSPALDAPETYHGPSPLRGASGKRLSLVRFDPQLEK